MTLQSQREVDNTRGKLQTLEESYERLSNESGFMKRSRPQIVLLNVLIRL